MALVSVPEIIREILINDAEVTTAAPGGVHVGGAWKGQDLIDGAVIIADAGQAAEQRYAALHQARIEVRTEGRTPAEADVIANVVFPKLESGDGPRRIVALQPSTGESFLIHWMDVTGGPSLSHDPEANKWVKLMFVELLIGTEPCP